MVRWLAVTLLLVGCTPTVDRDYVPLIGICASMDGEAPEPTPEPDNLTCDNCDSKGYLGDSRVRVDCPMCEIPWEQADPPEDPSEKSPEETPEEVPQETAVGPPEIPKPLSWHTTIEEALREPMAGSKPFLVVFTKNGCAPCELLKQNMESPEIQQVLEGMSRAIVNVSEQPNEGGRWGVRQFPHMTLTFRGRTLYHSNPPVGEEAFLRLIRDLAEQASRVTLHR